MFCAVRVKPDCFRVRKERGYKHLDAWLGSLAVVAGFSEHVRQALSSPWAMRRPRRVVSAAGTNAAVNVSGMRFPPRTWADLCVRDISQPWSTMPAGAHRTAWCSAFLPYEVMNALSSIILYERKWSWNKSVSDCFPTLLKTGHQNRLGCFFQGQCCSRGAPALYMLCSGSHSLSWNTLFLLSCQVCSNECTYALLFPPPAPAAVETWMTQKQFRTFFKKLCSSLRTTQSNGIYIEG